MEHEDKQLDGTFTFDNVNVTVTVMNIILFLIYVHNIHC